MRAPVFFQLKILPQSRATKLLVAVLLYVKMLGTYL